MREHRWYSSLKCHILYTVFPRSRSQWPELRNIPHPDSRPQKDLRKSKWMLWSPCSMEIVFNAEMLKLTISTCSSRWLIWPPHWGITKPDKPLHDPEDISRAGRNRNIGILFASEPLFGSTDKRLSIFYDKFKTFQQLGFYFLSHICLDSYIGSEHLFLLLTRIWANILLPTKAHHIALPFPPQKMLMISCCDHEGKDTEAKTVWENNPVTSK